jgi:hypothetical protein
MEGRRQLTDAFFHLIVSSVRAGNLRQSPILTGPEFGGRCRNRTYDLAEPAVDRPLGSVGCQWSLLRRRAARSRAGKDVRRDDGGGEIARFFLRVLNQRDCACNIDPPASSYAIMRRAGRYRGENSGPGKDDRGELDTKAREHNLPKGDIGQKVSASRATSAGSRSY